MDRTRQWAPCTTDSRRGQAGVVPSIAPLFTAPNPIHTSSCPSFTAPNPIHSHRERLVVRPIDNVPLWPQPLRELISGGSFTNKEPLLLRHSNLVCLQQTILSQDACSLS